MKRYIRTKDGKIYDTTTLTGFRNEIAKQHNLEEMHKIGREMFYLGYPIIAESDNIFDLIQKWDLIGGLWFGIEDKRCCKDVYSIIPNISVYTATGESCSFIDIQWIFTKQGDNYILVWDKERGII